MADPIPCPKCGNLLAPCGELDADGETLAVYTCDTCVRLTKFCGEEIEAALSFARKPDGTIVDPGDTDVTLKF